jgi:single-strand DNA-binding protein
MYQKTIIVGRLGDEPEGKKVGENFLCSIGVATYEVRNNVQHTEWWNVSIWGKVAEWASNTLHKGDTVMVELRRETKKNGDKRFTNWNCERINLIPTGRKPEGGAVPASNDEWAVSQDDKDLPF